MIYYYTAQSQNEKEVYHGSIRKTMVEWLIPGEFETNYRPVLINY